MTESYPLPSGRDFIADAVEWKGFVEELKRQWKLLWRERIDDKVRAEGIANIDFEMLFVDKGTVIIATRCYKQTEFKEILEQYDMPYEVKLKQEAPPIQVGGWRKFGREMAVTQRKLRRQWSQAETTGKGKNMQLKKGGRGWLHVRAR
jgi:hypothetical protein